MNSHPTTISRRFPNFFLWMAALWPWCGGNVLADSASTKNVGPLPQPATVWGVKPARYGLEKPYFMVDNLSGMTQRSKTDSLQVAKRRVQPGNAVRRELRRRLNSTSDFAESE